MKKKVTAAIGIILAVYILFVTADCIRLQNKTLETEPFITISSSQDAHKSKYTGLGYSVVYHRDGQENTDKNTNTRIYGAEFMLFDKILLWGWIE